MEVTDDYTQREEADEHYADMEQKAIQLGFDSFDDMLVRSGNAENGVRKIVSENQNYRSMEVHQFNFTPNQDFKSLIVGWDSEWQDYYKDDNTFDYRVHVSSQFYVTADCSSHFIYHSDGKVYISSLVRYLKKCYPNLTELTLAAHWSRAEVSQLQDAHDLIWQEEHDLRIINKTFTARKSEYFKGIKFNLVDTNLFMSGALEKIGKWLGIPKIDTKGNITKMLEWWKTDPESCMEYALTDAKICCLFYEEILKFQKKIGMPLPVHTVGSLFEKSMHKKLGSKKNEARALSIGYKPKNVYVQIAGKKSHSRRTVVADDYKHDKFKAVYYGGRNETYLYGKYQGNMIFDYDLTSAYGSIMSIIPQWTARQMEKSFYDPKELYEFLQKDKNILSHGFIDVSHFRFKEDVQYPGFPIKESGSLIFVREGSTAVTLQEFFIAYPYLERCELKADVYPVLYDSEGNVHMSLVAEFANDIKRMRDEAKKSGDNFTDQMAKLVNNSGYGKFAQGMSDRSGLNIDLSTPEAVKSTKIPPSKISNSFIASYITGLVRAEIAEYLYYCGDNHILVGNVTTDGFTTINRPLTDAELKSCGHLTRVMAELNQRYFNTPYILDLKHQGVGGIFIKTRAYTMLKKAGDLPLLSSITGIYQKNLKTIEHKIEMIDSEFTTVDRFKDTRYLSESFPSMKDYLSANAPFAKTPKSVTFNWDYDFKRIPETPEDYEGRIKFGTTPHTSIEQYRQVREAYQNYCRGEKDSGGGVIGNKNKIVTAGDWNDFQRYYAFTEILTQHSLNKRIVQNLPIIIYCQHLKVTYKLGKHRIADIVQESENNVKRWIKGTEVYEQALVTAPEYIKALVEDFDKRFTVPGVINAI